MNRAVKIVLFSVGGAGLLVVILVAAFLIEVYRPHPEHHVSKEAPLSNGGILRVHGLEYTGPHGFPYFWDATYKTSSAAASEKVGFWGGGAVDGDVVGCPVADLVVVNPLLSHTIFVRNAAGTWKFIDIEIPGKSPSPFGIERVVMQTSLSAEDIQKLHDFFLALAPNLDSFRPNRMQFVAGAHELWADFSTRIGSSLETECHRVRLKLSDDGEHFRLVDISKISVPKGPFQPDRDPDPQCTRVYPFADSQ